MMVFGIMLAGYLFKGKVSEGEDQAKQLQLYASAIKEGLKSLESNPADREAYQKEILDNAAKLKKALLPYQGGSEVALLIKKLTDNISDIPTAKIYADKLDAAVSQLVEKVMAEKKAELEKKIVVPKTGEILRKKQGQVDLKVTPVMMKPIDVLKLRGLVHSLNENSGSDFNFGGLNMTAEQENAACMEALDLAVELKIISGSERYLINERGNDPLTDEQRRNLISVIIAVVGVGKGNADKMFSVVKGLETQGDISAAIFDPVNGSSFVVEELGRAIRLSGAQADLWKWAMGVVQNGDDLATAKRKKTIEVKKTEVKIVEKKSTEVRELEAILQKIKPPGLELPHYKKEKFRKTKNEPVKTEVKTVEEKKPTVLDEITSSLEKVKPRGLENMMKEKPVKTKKEPVKTKAPVVEKKETVPPQVVPEEKTEVVPKEEKAKETISSKYPELEGVDLDTKIDWVNALWSDKKVIDWYGKQDKDNRLKWLMNFLENAKMDPGFYESMENRSAETLIYAIEIFKSDTK